jgi:hypothetical protein
MDTTTLSIPTQNTNDTLIPVSKNFLKKTLIKNEAIKKANKELLDLYNIAVNKKPKIVEIEKVKYITKDPTLSEKYDIYEKINAEINATKELKNKKNKELEQKIKKRKEQIEFENYKELQNNEIYKDIKKDSDLLNRVYFDSIRKKKKILKHYADAMDKDIDNANLKIQVYDMILGK